MQSIKGCPLVQQSKDVSDAHGQTVVCKSRTGMTVFGHFLLGSKDVLNVIDSQRRNDDVKVLQMWMLVSVKELFSKNIDQELE